VTYTVSDQPGRYQLLPRFLLLHRDARARVQHPSSPSRGDRTGAPPEPGHRQQRAPDPHQI